MKVVLYRLIAVALFAAAAQSYAQDVGRVLLAAGDAVAIRGTQTVRLALGSAVQEKDVLRTGPASNLQVRFIDESIMSLRENSELCIDEFRFSGKEDGSERAFFRLVKGGLRTVTGLVGRTNNRNYGVISIASTIGIRGSDFSTRLCQQDCVKADGSLERDGQFGSVHGPSHGTNRINVNNEAERDGRTFGMNEHFYVADIRSIIDRLLVPPEVVSNRLEGRGKPTAKPAGAGNEQTAAGGASHDSRGTAEPPPPPPPPAFVATENRDSSGAPAVVGGAPTIAGVGAFANIFFFFAQPDPGTGGGFFTPSNVTTDPAGAASNLATPQRLLGFSIPPGFAASSGSNSGASASASSPSSVIDDTTPNAINAHWGRWTSGSFTDEDGTQSITVNNQFHYLYGPLTPPEVVAAKTGSFAMVIVGGTTPTNNLNEAITSFSASPITVNFTARTVTFPAISINFPTQNWTFPGPNSTPIQFAAGKGAFIEQTVSGTCGPNSGCSGSALLGKTGIFMGPAGDNLGVSFAARTTSGPTASAQTAKLYTCSPSC